MAKYDEFALKNRVQSSNIFGYIATEIAYNQGEKWLEELKDVIISNYNYVKARLEKELDLAIITPLEATYLMWIDLKEYLPKEEVADFVKNKCKLALDYGDWFYDNKKSSHIRINLATSKELLDECIDRLLLIKK